MKSHPRSRLYVGNGLASQDEAAAFVARQSIHAVKDTPLPLPPLPRDWKTTLSVLGGVGAGVLFVAVLIVAIMTSR